ncbi:Uncharacterized protein dnm_046810 [Desulfonema magnum]|uniref:Uncharacterized protein n=1 Tax=Desulfonema magnum TaxID=45655 RepID=A0A975GPA5_9BACT|nr:Uncharacterized protein dnm_046810 [Desulfonema magnum]
MTLSVQKLAINSVSPKKSGHRVKHNFIIISITDISAET